MIVGELGGADKGSFRAAGAGDIGDLWIVSRNENVIEEARLLRRLD